MKDLETGLNEKKPNIDGVRPQLKESESKKKRLKQQIAQLQWEGAFQSLRMGLPFPIPSQGNIIWNKIKITLGNEGIISLIKKSILYGGMIACLIGRNLINRQFGALAYGMKGIMQITLTKNKKKADQLSLTKMISSEVQIKNYDIICFPIIDWFFRYQRPQQILSQFAKNGSRVFYINPKFYNRISDLFLCKEIQDGIFDVSITANPLLNIYQDVIDETSLEDMIRSMRSLKKNKGIIEAIMIVHLPFWQSLAKKIKEEFGWKILYDCMDEHSGFSTNNKSMVSREVLLVRESDLLIASSRPLYEKWKNKNPNCILLPNAADFEHFSTLPLNDLLSKIPKPIIGYYGAISDWFDNGLIEYLADEKKDWSFVFIGHTFGSNLSRLGKMPNVHFLGEKPYQDLPAYLYWFDVCIIPFRLNELTKATNPVKFYEFMSSGEKVVSVELPELHPYSKYLYLAKDRKDFFQKIMTALLENDPSLITKRIQLARENTWGERFRILSKTIRGIYPKVSIIVVTYNNLLLTKLCLESIFSKSHYPNYEVIVVDNNSNDGTKEYLRELAAGRPQVKVIFNPLNNGFSKANNQGILASSGEYIFLLNNDTIVTRGWLTRLLRHLQDEKIGLVGPVTNFSGNESRIEVPYLTVEEIEEFSEKFIKEHARPENFDIKVLAMFCTGMRRRLIDEVGLFDEQFQIGMFEDDDYAHRVRMKGYRVVCAEDVFIHHFGEASFNKLKETGEYRKIFEENKKRFEKKWDRKWKPQKYREVKMQKEW